MSRGILPVIFGLTFRSLIHFEFIFEYGVRECSNFLLLNVSVQFCQQHLLKRLFLHCIFLLSLNRLIYHISVAFFCFFFYSISLIYNLFQCHTILITVTLYYSMKYRSLIPPIFSFFPKIVLGIQGLLFFSTSLSFICSRSVKKQASQDDLRKVPSFAIFLEQFGKIGIDSSVNICCQQKSM